jgi:hypothetical protein
LDITVASLLQAFYVMEQIDRTMLSPREVLDQTHHHAIFGVGLDDEGRNFALADPQFVAKLRDIVGLYSIRRTMPSFCRSMRRAKFKRATAPNRACP